jgi:protein tyrosine/serine phosphatase
MKETLMGFFEAFIQSTKDAMRNTRSGSKITVSNIENHISLRSEVMTKSLEDGKLIAAAAETLVSCIQIVTAAEDIHFTFIMKNENGKVLVKNTLSPKRPSVDGVDDILNNILNKED